MPAGIRIDIHMGSISALAVDISGSSQEFLDSLASRLSEAVQACILENTNNLQDEVEGSLTSNNIINAQIKEGLGNSWPQEQNSPETTLLGDGISEHIERLRTQDWDDELFDVDSYDDGTRYIHIRCDLG